MMSTYEIHIIEMKSEYCNWKEIRVPELHMNLCGMTEMKSVW